MFLAPDQDSAMALIDDVCADGAHSLQDACEMSDEQQWLILIDAPGPAGADAAALRNGCRYAGAETPAPA